MTNTNTICDRLTRTVNYPEWPTTPEAKAAAIPLYLTHRLVRNLDACCNLLWNAGISNRCGTTIADIELTASQARYVVYALYAVELITGEELDIICAECNDRKAIAIDRVRANRTGRCKATRAARGNRNPRA
jgi:hypothetical protein